MIDDLRVKMECRSCGKSDFKLTIQKNHNGGTTRYRRCVTCNSNIGAALSLTTFEQLKSSGYSVVDLGAGSQQSLVSNNSLPKSTLFKNEKEVQDWFFNVFDEWFYIAKEVPGKHLVEAMKVRMDFMLYPRSSLSDMGFYKGWFGVEVKLFPNHREELSAPSKALWQAVSYNDSEFYLNQSKTANFNVSSIEGATKPFYTMIFSNRSFNKGKNEYLNQNGEKQRNQFDYIMRTISTVGLYAKVGMVNIIESSDNSNIKKWSFDFGRETYCSFVRETNVTYRQTQFKLHNEEIIKKIRVGHQ
ncbi:hypothetical protein ACXHPE_16970 [Vibrio cincinnatiensis]|uniref:hypothetical protein n=1 Tax=Vibrio cincinnatiensis TaxID=675 RepID=UPI001FA9433F|nr:hypothetical protein [Vibrio cincinnatiensis]